MKRTAKLAVFLAAWLMTQGIISMRAPKEKSSRAVVLVARGSLAARPEVEAPHTHSELMISESQPTTAVRSVSGNEIYTTAHFNSPSCGGRISRRFTDSRELTESEVRKQLRESDTWCDARSDCDWHGIMQGDFELRLTHGQWLKTFDSLMAVSSSALSVSLGVPVWKHLPVLP